MAQVKFGYQVDFRNPPGSGRSFDQLYNQMFRKSNGRRNWASIRSG